MPVRPIILHCTGVYRVEVLPRVEAGWKAVDVAKILSSGPREWADVAVNERALLVTYPANIVVRSDYRKVSITLGVGSLVFPPDSKVEGLMLARPEWIDGCYVKEFEAPEKPASGIAELEPPLLGMDIRDPVALFANGRRWHGIAGHVDGVPIVADNKGNTVVAAHGESYNLAVVEGEALEPLEYIIGLYTPCIGR